MAIVYPASCNLASESIKVEGSTDSYFSNGNVGFKTTSPSYPIDASGRCRVRGTGASGGGGFWLSTSGNPTSNISFMGRGTDAEAFFGVYNNGGWRLVVKDSDGNVGIGTTSPARKLHIVDTSDEPLRYDCTKEQNKIDSGYYIPIDVNDTLYFLKLYENH